MPTERPASPRSSPPQALLMGIGERAPVMAFVLVAYLWAWILWGYWIPAMPPQGLVITAPFLLCAIGGGFGPSLSALLLTGLTGGVQSIRHLAAGLLRFRVAAGWYAVALLLVPSLTCLSLLIQSRLVGPLHWPEGGPMIALGLIWPVLAALGEELGWRGFMLPRVARRVGLLGGALWVGLAWGMWHLPADYIGLKGYGDWFWAAFLLQGPILLTAHAVIMAWLWQRTHANLLLMAMYHWSITASAILAPVAADSGAPAVAAAAITTALVVVAALLLAAVRWPDFSIPRGLPERSIGEPTGP